MTARTMSGLRSLNVGSFAVCLAINAWSGAKKLPAKVLDDQTGAGDESRLRIRPAHWAFAIWGLIYVLELGFL